MKTSINYVLLVALFAFPRIAAAQYFNNITTHGSIDGGAPQTFYAGESKEGKSSISPTSEPISLVDQYRTIGAYRVTGTSYLLEGSNSTDIYTKQGIGRNLDFLFDVYDQRMGILQPGRTSVMYLENNMVDSFVIRSDSFNVLKPGTKFIFAASLDPSKKFYVEAMTAGAQFKLFKYTKAEMKSATADLAQSTLKAFEFVNYYFYSDQSEPGVLKKLIPSPGFLKKTFKDHPAAIALLATSSFGSDTDATLNNFFRAL